jgi:hypothetical protein
MGLKHNLGDYNMSLTNYNVTTYNIQFYNYRQFQVIQTASIHNQEKDRKIHKALQKDGQS